MQQPPDWEVLELKAFIKDYNFVAIKKKLILLYILNVSDIIFTFILLKTNLFEEQNIIMINAVQNLLTSILLKVVLPALLLFYLYLRIQKANNTQLKKSNVLINIAVSFYALIDISHLVWIIFFPFFLFYIKINLAL